MRVKRMVTNVAVTLTLGMVGVAAAPGSAPADVATDTPGYDTEARTEVKLDGPQPPANVPQPPLTSSPPPLCWWSPLAANYGDPEVFAEAYRTQAQGRSGDMAEREFLKLPAGAASLEAAEQEEGVTWYMLRWDTSRFDGGTDLYEELAAAGCTTSRPSRGAGSPVAVLYNFFRTNEVPLPEFDVKELALYA